MLKKGISLFLALVMALGMIPTEAMAATTLASDEGSHYEEPSELLTTEIPAATNETAASNATTRENQAGPLYYSVNEDGTTCRIIDCDQSISGDFEIPSEIDGYPVIEIGSNAFRSCDFLTSVTIPKGVISIGESAFQYCSSLENVNIPDGVTIIGDYAFIDCYSLERIIIPEGTTYIGSNCFRGCSALESVSIPKSATVVKHPFENCPLLISAGPKNGGNKYNIEFSWTEQIPNDVFSGSSLQKIELPNSLKNIGDGAFSNCVELQSITIPEGVTSIGNYAFSTCIALQSITIPEGVTSIGESAFRECAALKSVIIPESVITIGIPGGAGAGVFSDCPLLTSAGPIDDEVEYNIRFSWKEQIPDNAFDCSDLHKIKLPDTIKDIGMCAFSSCSELENITIPESVTSIGDCAFQSCSSLESVNIPNGVTSIGGATFDGCYELKNINIPEEVTSIGNNAFYDCWALEDINIPEGVTNIGDGAFYNCSALKTIIIPEKVTIIGEKTFYRCSSLERVVLPEGLTSIKAYAFAYCTLLKNINIPKTLTGIWEYAFIGCGVENIDIPGGVKSISWNAFQSCKALKTVTISQGVTSIGKYAFFNCSSLESINIPESVTSINEYAFSNCSSLKNINIPKGVDIGIFAFSNCSSLNNVSIPEGVTNIGEGAFYNCENLSKVIIPNSLTTINFEFDFDYNPFEGPFEKCPLLISAGPLGSGCSIEFGWKEQIPSGILELSSIEKLIIPSGITTISNSAFSQCASLTSVTIPEGVTSIGDNAFYACLALNDITIPEGVTSIGQYAFFRCLTLKNVIIPEGIETIELGAFEGCTNLVQVTLPRSIKNIEDVAFYYCINLQDIYYAGTEEDRENIEISESDYKATELMQATWHYNSTGPDDPDTPMENGLRICYLSEWDADNQIAYFEDDLLHLGAEVTEATDTSFLDTVQDMVGHSVLVETKARDDGMIGPDILIRMELVEAGTGTIQERTEDSLTIHDTVYPLALKGEEPLFGADKDDEVLYGVQDGKIVILVPLTTTTMRLEDWDPDSRVLTVSSDLTTYTYKVSTLASEESLAFLNASRDSSKDYSIEFAYDSSSKIAYRVYRIYEEPEDPEYYDTPTYETTEEALLGEYAMEWYQAYGDYTDALNTALAHYAESEDGNRATLINTAADGMKKEDMASNSRYLNWDREMPKIPDSVVNAGYKALAALLYDNACKNPDFSNVDFSNATAGTTLVKAIMKSMSSTTTSYSFGGVKVQLSVLQFGSAKFGDMTCTLNGKQYSAIICSTQTECYETIEAYWESLKDLETQALFNIYTAVATDIWGKSPTKFTKEFLKKHVEKYADELLKAGVGNVADVLNACYNYYSYVNKISNGDLDNLENLLGAMGSLKFDDSSITDKVVNKAMKVLKNATNKLNQACADYIAGTLEIPPLFSLKQLIVACPVNVMIYNATGEQIGYVGEDDLWYEDSIRITEEGDAKIIDILSAQDVSVRFIGTAAGSMSCSIEEYTTEGVPIGRLNFYQIPVQEGQKMEMKLPQRLTGSLQDACIQTGTDMIYPNEYITVNDAGSVLVACNVDPQAIQNGCTVSGDGYYVRGDAVVLTAISGANYNFIGWYQDGILQSTSQVYEFPAIENVEVSAAFAQTYQGFEVEVSGQEGGLAVGSSIFASGETAAVFAIPDEGYQFSGWYIGNVLVSEAPEYEFVVNSDTTLLAKFTAISASHVMSYVESIPATCIDTGIFAHWHCSECNKDFSDADGTTELSSIVIPIDPTNHAGGTEVRNAVEATYESEGYTGDTYCLGCNTKIADGTTIPKKTQSGSTSSGGSTSTYTITLEEFENGTVTASHKQAPHGTTVTLTITPEEGFTLESLTVRDRNDNMIRVTFKSETIYSFTMPSSPVQIAAVFSQAINDPDTPLGDLPFLDVSPEAWYKNAVGYVFENGLMSGTSSTTFSPDITTSRGMIVTTLYRLAQSPSASGSSTFLDVEDGQWYSDAIVWASANNIVSGYGNGMFGPDDPVTREQMATILYRYAQFKGYPTTSSTDLSKYTDLELLSTWAQEPMKWANVFGIITGTTATTLNPQGNATRAEMAAMLMRFCENIAV